MRTLRILTVFILFLASALYMQGCGRDSKSSPTLSPLPIFESAVATASVEESLMPLPTPSPGLAVVGGVIIDMQTQSAPLEGTVYLGGIVSMDNGKPIARLDRDTAPFAIPMESGQFMLQDVEPGEYGLVLYTPEISFLVDDPQGEGSLIFTVVPDQVLDLGKIKVLMP